MAKSIPVRRHERRRLNRRTRRRSVVRAFVLSLAARARLAMLDWHRAHGGNVARTARHFGFSRPTVYRGLARDGRFHLGSLEDRPSRRIADAGRALTSEELLAVRDLRNRYPRSRQGQAPGPPPTRRDPALW